jgi:flavorubredoxin
MDRVRLVNPGQQIILGERTLTAWKPPAFDNPTTTGFVDNTSGALFSSDCFGALLDAVPQSAADLMLEELRQGQVFWATVDSPWLQNVDPAAFAAALHRVRDTEPTLILSSHLPVAPGAMIDQLIDSLEAVPTATPFLGPDQAALEAMLAQMAAPLSP